MPSGYVVISWCRQKDLSLMGWGPFWTLSKKRNTNFSNGTNREFEEFSDKNVADFMKSCLSLRPPGQPQNLALKI